MTNLTGAQTRGRTTTARTRRTSWPRRYAAAAPPCETRHNAAAPHLTGRVCVYILPLHYWLFTFALQWQPSRGQRASQGGVRVVRVQYEEELAMTLVKFENVVYTEEKVCIHTTHTITTVCFVWGVCD